MNISRSSMGYKYLFWCFTNLLHDQPIHAKRHIEQIKSICSFWSAMFFVPLAGILVNCFLIGGVVALILMVVGPTIDIVLFILDKPMLIDSKNTVAGVFSGIGFILIPCVIVALFIAKLIEYLQHASEVHREKKKQTRLCSFITFID